MEFAHFGPNITNIRELATAADPIINGKVIKTEVFIMATKPTEGATSFIDINTGTRKLTGFGREYEYLTGKGYVYDEISKKMIK